MKRSIFTIAFAIFSLFSISAQDLNSVLSSMPNDIVTGLDATRKDKLIANPQDTSIVIVEREIIGSVKRLAISSDYISLETSGSGTIQIKLLPLINDSKIICVVKTVCGGACDSQIKFFTTKWEPISQDLFPKKSKDWFIKADADRESQEFKNAYATLDMTPVKLILSPNGTTLEANYEINNYLSEEDYKKIQPFLIEDAKTFEWDKTSYK